MKADRNQGTQAHWQPGSPGRYLALHPRPGGQHLQRIGAEAERNRLRALGVLIKPPSGSPDQDRGGGHHDELLIDDLESLLRQWRRFSRP